MNVAAVYGLVLAGGRSSRMQSDKAALQYQGIPQLQRAYELLARHCVRTFISIRPEQRQDELRTRWPQIVDEHPNLGPLAGIAAAQAQHPETAWLVIACDLPMLNEQAVQLLLQQRDATRFATAYRGADGLPEPLCTIWEPHGAASIRAAIEAGKLAPRTLLQTSDALLIDPVNIETLNNVNTAAEYQRSSNAMHTLSLHLQYFAIFREQAGKRSETLETHAITPALLYAELQQRYGFRLAATQLKVAVNNAFCDWQQILKSGDKVAFIPPVAGG